MCAVIANLVPAPKTGCDGIFPWTISGRSQNKKPGGTRQRRCTGLDLSFDVSRNAEEIRGLELWQVRAKPCRGILVYGERYGRKTRGSTMVCKVCRRLGYRPQALMDYTCQTCMRVFGSLGFPWPVMRRYLKDGRSETAPVSHLLRFDVNRLHRVLDSVRGRTHVSVRASQPQKAWRPTHMQVLSQPRLLREGLEGLHVDDLHRSARSQVLRSARRPQA